MLLRHLFRRFSSGVTAPPAGWTICRAESADVAKALPAFASFGDRLVGSFDSMKCEFRQELQPSAGINLSHSWFRLLLPFSSEKGLREKYVLFNTAEMRIGKIMEVLDALAGDAAFRYIRASMEKNPATISMTMVEVALVTAALDRMVFCRPLRVDRDLVITSQVTWVGNTSIEVQIDLEQDTKVGRAMFVFATRNKRTKKGVPLMPPVLQNDEDVKYMERGNKNRARRMKDQAESLDVLAPTAEETTLVHSMLTRKIHEKEHLEGAVPMSTAQITNSLIMHRQDRNINDQMFGGHLMRVALEAAWGNAFTFAKRRPFLHAIEGIHFIHPVEIGSLVLLKTSIAYVNPEERLVLCDVTLEAHDLEKGTSQLSNDMKFIFSIEGDTPLPLVCPHSYEEVLRYLGARRKVLGRKRNGFTANFD